MVDTTIDRRFRVEIARRKDGIIVKRMNVIAEDRQQAETKVNSTIDNRRFEIKSISEVETMTEFQDRLKQAFG